MSSIVVSAMVMSAVPALAAEDRGDGSADVQAAMQRDLGLTPEQAKAQDELQQRAAKLDTELQASLGEAYAGSQYDMRSGRMIIAVSERGALEKVKAAGAEPLLVEHSLKELESIQAQLDGDGGGDPHREAAAKTKAAQFTGWYIDAMDNAVHITATRAQAGAAKELQAAYGDAITVELSEDVPEPTANWMDGGDGINGNSCSAGFNLRNPWTGQGYLLTAGHCVSAGSTLRGQGNVSFGTVNESWFDYFDDSITRKTNNYWIQGAWVDTNPSNGGIVITNGYTDLPPGFVICKSGITTKWTCGVITAKNQTVNYTGGFTVHHLTRHNACVEPGDSGGANVSVLGGYHAEGVTSGASMIYNPVTKKKYCKAKYGQANVSWYFPISNSLSYYGPKYGVTTW
jgi:streptogrisin C